MRFSRLFIVIFLLLITPSRINADTANIKNNINVESSGGNSSVRVDIKNNVNTDSSTSTSNTDTSVKIHQTGDGTSQVNVNGKEYKVEGAGDFSINENSTTNPSDQKSTPMTPKPIPTIDIPNVKKSVESSILTNIKKTFQQFRSIFLKFFGVYFKPS